MLCTHSSTLPKTPKSVLGRLQMVNGSISKQKMLAGRFPTQQGVISAAGDTCPHQIQYLLI